MSTPTEQYRRTEFHQPDRVLRGLDASVHALIGAWRRKTAAIGQLRADAT